MKFRNALFFRLAFVISLASLLNAQSASDRFVSGEGNFTIAVAGKPTERKDVNVFIGDFELVGESVVWKREDGTFIGLENFVVYGENPKVSSVEKKLIVNKYKNSTLEQFAKLNIATAVSPYIFNGFSGFELRGTAAGRVVVRIFFGKNRLYALSVVRRDVDGFDAQTSMLNTFRLLTTEEYIAARIVENTPEALPQLPVPNWPLSDASERDLKGKVKEVIEDFQESPKSPRKRWGEELYNESGNLTREISFLAGYPDDISVWGWVDSMRVSRSNYVDYPFGEGPNEKTVTSILEAPRSPATTSVDAKIIDKRFDSRYEFKFDSNNRILERTTISNEGTPTMTEKFYYSNNRRERVWGYARENSSAKEIHVLDTSGIIVENQGCDANGRKCDVELFKYEFDTKGNWIVKRIFKKKMVKGKPALTLTRTHFRTIEYYG